jgi:hypothetical protein
LITLNGIDLCKMLESTEDFEFSNFIFKIENPLNVDIKKITIRNKFENCIFEGIRMDFINTNISEHENPLHSFEFKNCTFNIKVFFKDCSIDSLIISNFKNIKKLHLATKKIAYINLYNDKDSNIEEFDFVLNNSEVLNSLIISGVKAVKSDLEILKSKIGYLVLVKNNINQLDISKSIINRKFEFQYNSVSSAYLKNCVFNRFYFIENNLEGNIYFKYNNFNETTIVEKNTNIKRGGFNIIQCDFNRYTYFNNNNLYNIQIDTSKFADTTSFQDVSLVDFKLDKTIFEKTPFFDDFTIQNLNNCSYRTIRNLKQQLLRSDNSIDYNFYRSIEHSIYKKHLKTKIKTTQLKKDKKRLKRDLTILRVNDFFSDNGVNWCKAIKRTLFLSILFYLLFFIAYNYSNNFDLKYYNSFIVGYFKFLLITDYHDPLAFEKTYIKLWHAWIPFIFGKIIIGVGIYEIIISFRKFKK